MADDPLDKFRYNLKRLLRHGYSEGIRLNDLSALYNRFFNYSVEPKDFLSNCTDWRTVFQENDLLKQHFVIVTVDNISILTPRDINETEEFDEVSEILKVMSYTNYIHEKQCRTMEMLLVPEETEDNSNSNSETTVSSSTSNVVCDDPMSNQFNPSNINNSVPSSSDSRNTESQLEEIQEVVHTNSRTHDIRSALEQARPVIVSNLYRSLYNRISNSNRSRRGSRGGSGNSSSNSRGAQRTSGSSPRGGIRPRRLGFERVILNGRSNCSTSSNGEMEPNSINSESAATNIRDPGRSGQPTGSEPPEADSAEVPTDQIDTVTESIESVVRSISAESNSSNVDSDENSNPGTIARRRRSNPRVSRKKFIGSNNGFAKIVKEVHKGMLKTDLISRGRIDSDMGEPSEWVVFSVCDCKFNTNLGSRGFYKRNGGETTRFNGETWESFTHDYFDDDTGRSFKTFQLPTKSIVYGEFVRKIGGSVVFRIIDCITWRGFDLRHLAFFSRRLSCWEMENYKTFALPDSWIEIEMMKVTRMKDMEDQLFKKIQIQYSYMNMQLVLEDFGCYKSSTFGAPAPCTMTMYERETSSTMHVDGVVFMKIMNADKPFDFGQTFSNKKLYWKFNSDICISSRNDSAVMDQSNSDSEIGLWTFLEKMGDGNGSRRN